MSTKFRCDSPEPKPKHIDKSKQRVWLILDELPSLHYLPSLTTTMAESRKFGGCVVLGMQSFSQLQQNYGQHQAKAIIDLCNTRLFFRSPSINTADWVAKELGKGEYLELQEGMSYGANTVRDGVSINQQRIKRLAVPEDEIIKLADLTAILSIAPTKSTKTQLTWPVAKVRFPWIKRKIKSLAFVAVKKTTNKNDADSTTQKTHDKKATNFTAKKGSKKLANHRLKQSNNLNNKSKLKRHDNLSDKAKSKSQKVKLKTKETKNLIEL